VIQSCSRRVENKEIVRVRILIRIVDQVSLPGFEPFGCGMCAPSR
jgi:hypothetical protein